VTLHRVEQIMGTAISLEIADPVPDGVADEVFDWFREVDARFSTYKDDSEVSRWHRREVTEPSADLATVLHECARLWQVTDGFFDAYCTGRLDPSGYVKGWSVQVASDRLRAAGAVNHCVNAGGDLRVSGSPEPGRPWRVGLRHPFDAGSVFLVLAGTDLAVATSGLYERGEHVLNPRTGTPATYLASVTVTGPDLGTADAYATAAVAMGADGPRWLAGLAGYESAVVTADGGCLTSAGLPVAP